MTFRGFVAVDVPPLPALDAVLRELRETRADVKVVDPAQVHLTLKFLGDTEEALVPKIREALGASVAGVPRFTARLAGTGAFPNLRRPRILWVGLVGAEPLVGIARRIEAAVEPLGYPPEGRDFSPHVTIARVRGGRDIEEARSVLAAHERETFGEVPVDTVRLKKSVLTPQGPLYSTVEEIPL